MYRSLLSGTHKGSGHSRGSGASAAKPGRTDEARRTWQLALRMFEEFDGDPRTAYVRTQLKELSLQGG